MSGDRDASVAGIRTLIAFDVGTRRVGVAVGNTLLRQGQALATIDAAGDARWAAIGRVLAEWQPHALVVGVPRHPDGEPHAMTAAALRFARQLRGRHRLPVHEVDERYTTTEAAAEGSRNVDAGAAAIILGQYLNAPDHAAA
ncbi:MAG: Holliday junction resolvase RuvX [Rubrivivax sp.]|nr:Holliday junction resolvase RuvX [Rubrivivax sp.]